MKRFITLFTAFLFFSVSTFADISTYKSEVITVEDVLDDFIELLNGLLNEPMYRYGSVDYKVYKEPDEQNYYFKTVTSDASYTGPYYNVKGKAATLYFTNGYLTVRTYSEPIDYSMKSCFDLNTEKGRIKFYDFFNICVEKASETSIRWLDKYGKLGDKEFESISRLSLLNGRKLFGFSTQDRDTFIWRDIKRWMCYNFDTFNGKSLNDSYRHQAKQFIPFVFVVKTLDNVYHYQVEQPDLVFNCLHKFYGYNLFWRDELINTSFDTRLKYVKKHKNKFIPVQQWQMRCVVYLSDNNYMECIYTYEKLIKGQDLIDADIWCRSDKLGITYDEELIKGQDFTDVKFWYINDKLKPIYDERLDRFQM